MKRFVAFSVVGALMCFSLVLGTAPQGGAVTEAVTFSAVFDPAVAGGQWLLTTYTGGDEDLPIALGGGRIPADGVLGVEVPLALASSTSRYFVLRGLLALDKDHGRFATASRGVASGDVTSGATIDLGRTEVLDVLMDEAQAAIPTTPEGTFDPGTVPQVGLGAAMPPKIAKVPTNAGLTGLPPADVPNPFQPQAAGVNAPSPSVNCRYYSCNEDSPSPPPGGGGNPSNNEPRCSGQWYGAYDCIDFQRDYTGILAFRGHGQRPAGAFQTFEVKFSNVQEWENGIRLNAGPFQADGKTMRQFTSSSMDQWPERGDCWAPPQPGDRNCATDATEANFGRDTWRWEKHTVYWCTQYGCRTTRDERLREKSYDGGTEVPSPGSPGNNYYYEQPSLVHAGVYGSWASYLPGSKHSFFLGNQHTYSGGARFTLNPPNGWGSAEFSSTMTNKSLKETTNTLELRNVQFMGKWYRYDGGNTQKPWQKEYWSCEFAPGWTGDGTACWDVGA